MLFKTLAFLSLLLTSNVAGAQSSTSPRPTPIPAPSLREIEENARKGAVLRTERKPKPATKAELRAAALETAVLPQVYEKYRDLLSLWPKESGLVRVFPDFDCEAKWALKVGGDCSKHVAGRSKFTLSPKSTLSLHLNNGKISQNGVLTHLLLTDLGEIAFEEAGITSPGIVSLRDFVPASDFSGAQAQYRQFRNGINFAGISVRDSVTPVVGRVYALRAIEFRGKIFNSPWSYGVASQSELENQLLAARWTERLDLIAVFSVVDVSDDGSLHILWHRLSKQRAPALRFSKPTPKPTFN